MHISKETVHIVVAESSVIVRGGVVAALDRLQSIKAHIIEVTSMDALNDCMRVHSPDMLIVNPLFCGKFSLPAIKDEYPNVKYLALATSFINDAVLNEYDGSISIFDSLDSIAALLDRLTSEGNIGVIGSNNPDFDNFQPDSFKPEEQTQEALSQREKEIVVCVVRGLTNKEIADELFLSIHTVITHRRNISRKLQIHSVAGLTIYAIANKLIDLKDLN